MDEKTDDRIELPTAERIERKFIYPRKTLKAVCIIKPYSKRKI